MKNKMEEIDDLIEQALTREESEYYKKLEEESISDMALGLYKGKLAWVAVYTTFIMTIAFAFTVYCGIKFWNAESIELMMKWGAGGFLGLLITSLLKLWNWMQMDKNTLIRHIKHLEFQISVLASKVKNQ